MCTVSDSSNKTAVFKQLKDLFHFSHFALFYRLYVPASILVGVVCGLFMVAFNLLIDGCTLLFSGLPMYIAPLIGGAFSSVLLLLGVKEIEGSGISKAIEMTHNPDELRSRTTVTKMVATAVSIGTGNPVGKEGPAVLIGAALGNFIGKRIGVRDPAHLRVFLMMGSAGCTAGIYKAPLGGALFATEAPYKRDAQLGYFVPVVLSAITAYMVYISIMGISPVIRLEANLELTLVLIPYLLLFGAIAGLLSMFFAIIMMLSRTFFRLNLPDWADPLMGSGLACVVIFLIGCVLDKSLTISGLSYNVITTVATSGIPVTILLLLLFGRLFAASFVVGGRVSGGVLASSIFVGALLGSVFGSMFFPDNIRAFVVLGMGAVLSANTNTPVATTIMMLELTTSFGLLIPMAICVSMSYLVSAGTSLYEGQKLTRNDEEVGYYPILKH